MSISSKGLAFSALMGIVLASTGASAQTAPKPAAKTPAPAAAPVGADPSATTAAFGDWVLRCVTAGEAAAAKRACELVQSVIREGQQAPVAQVAIGRLQAASPLRLTLVLPNNVALTVTPRVVSGEGDKQPLDLSWQRCLPGGCFSDAALKDEVLTKWRAATGMGQIAFLDGGGRQISIPFSLRGLPQALDALAKN